MNSELSILDGEYFYKSYNIIEETNKGNFIEESERLLKNYPLLIEPYPPLRSYFTIPEAYTQIKNLSQNECWRKLFKKIFSEVNLYYKNYLNSTPTLLNFWTDKVGFYSDQNIDHILYFDTNLNTYTDDAYHAHQENTSVVCIFYLQNCNKKYGTLIKTKNGSLVLSGQENSLSIFSSRLFHTAVYPTQKEVLEYPRYTIAFDFGQK